MTEETTTKKSRLKEKWKVIALALVGLASALYYVFSGESFDTSTITSLLGG